MSKLANAVLIGFISFLFLLAIFWYAVEVGESKQVGVVGLTTSWGSVNTEQTVIEGMVTFRNPHAFQVELMGLTYDFTVNGERLAGGADTGRRTMGAGSEVDVPFTMRFPSSFLPEWWSSHTLNGENSRLVIEGEGVFRVSSDSIPVPFRSQASWDDAWLESWSDALPNCPTEPPAPCVEESSFEWKRGASGVVLGANLRIHNPSIESLEVTDGDLGLTLSEVQVAEGSLVQPVIIPSGQSREVRFDARFTAADMLRWWPHHVALCETSRATLDVQVAYATRTSSPGANNTTVTEPVEDAVAWTTRLPNLETRFLCDP